MDDNLTNSMLQDIKDSIKAEIKSYVQKDVDKMLEDIAVELANRFYMRIRNNDDVLTNSRTIKLEMLFGDPNKPKKFESVLESEIVEVK